MKTMTVAMALIAALALPASAAAQPSDADQQAAHKQCKSERGKTRATREAFKAKYRSMSRCVRQNAVEEETERKQARTNAAKQCKVERDDLGPQAFADKYGDNKNKKNAYGKCVSMKAQENKVDMDADDEEDATEFRNAAKKCAAERRTMGDEAFATKYGTNRNKRNAFGKCVSAKTDES
jgi:hypothetical protein